MSCRPTYRRRRPERTLLYRTVQTQFETWLALARAGAVNGEPVPGYVEREFRRRPARAGAPAALLRPSAVTLEIRLPVGSYIPTLRRRDGIPEAGTCRAKDLVKRGEFFLRQPLSKSTLVAALPQAFVYSAFGCHLRARGELDEAESELLLATARSAHGDRTL